MTTSKSARTGREWLDNPAGLGELMPAGFTMGVATSAFQIEGAILGDGREPSTWDTFMAQPGRIADGSDAAVSTDHYHRYAEDVRLMRELGVDSYRFSLGWSRLQPGGRGQLSRSAVAFYDRLVDELLANGIKPMATLFHWDTPEALQHTGGWLERDTAHRFAEYAFLSGEAFGDRIESWVTVNEPATVTLNGYALGVHAPGATLLFDSLPAAHHQLLGHGLAVEALRAASVTGAIGITNVHSPVQPAGDSEDDALAAELFDIVHNRIYADPVLLGRYPQIPEPFEHLFGFLREIEPADLTAISAPLDFYGLNYYMPTRVAAGSPTDATTPDGQSPVSRQLPFSLKPWPEYPVTGFGWPVAPEFLAVALAEHADRYGDALPPLVITEGGASYPDVVQRDGSIDDEARVLYLAEHLAVAFAGVPGVTLRGYFVWSLLDNWEWTAGFGQRFGLVHVNFETQSRTPKRSFAWLQRLIGGRTR
ncbi:GH1 family beta-glucosidase [Conyzicola nivalis]|uniref:Beta-glucosidase n=2 Tax=Conyzicola nivalis TaxID=1477021 RepID=A0A916SSW0_9MICO|nr:beta-glucosidase [Conyzicola nivalis]